ncbi:arylsulfatase [Alteromonas sp. MMG017]|uniref:sulfatase family protein n=1 Tax=Alteromonas sp. MMG017 TaxID=2822692 RepID=UPI001B3A410C|nr:arylsulfatase [Alteromonas sp. MMG017]MBQ4828482.1 arylsulfatase [Alteromonas sp. MMG017]
MSAINGKTLLVSTAFLLLCGLGISGKAYTRTQVQSESETVKNKPNIVIFYVDDLGYNDIGANGGTLVSTPNIDQLASKGIRFTDAHSSSATCTPSRYSLLTGEYAFRNNAAVLPGDAPLIINVNKSTLPDMLSKAGYTSAMVGKWHLGLGDGESQVDWNQEVKPGPRQVGFDYSFILPSTGDRVPSVYMENGRVQNLDPMDPLKISYVEKIGQRPTGRENPELLRQQADNQHSDTIINGISRIGFMQGGKSAEWKDEEFYQVFTNKANHFIEQNAKKPFFLFFSFHDIHVPRLPNERFLGKSPLGIRGDAIMQMDWITGQVVAKLKAINALDNTLIIFTSDNGPVLNDGYQDGADNTLSQHQPGGLYRGGKYSAYEAGTRVPTIVHYPAKVKAGVSDALVSQIDIYASLASMLDIELDDKEAIDSEDYLATWLNSDTAGRTELIEESYTLALRTGDWKFIAPTDKTNPWIASDKRIESGMSPTPQLFNLKDDPQEQHNVFIKHPDKVTQYSQRIADLVKRETR